MSSRDSLVAVIKKHTECSNATANAVISDLLETIVKTAKKEGKVSLPGFGTFSVAKRAARKGFNPRTKQPITIKARKTFRFKPAANLRAL